MLKDWRRGRNRAVKPNQNTQKTAKTSAKIKIIRLNSPLFSRVEQPFADSFTDGPNDCRVICKNLKSASCRMRFYCSLLFLVVRSSLHHVK